MDFLVELEAVLQTCGPCGEGVEVCKVAVASLQEVSECPGSFRAESRPQAESGLGLRAEESSPTMGFVQSTL